MGKVKIAITLDEGYVEQIDRLVSERVFQNRSQAVQEAVSDKLRRVKRSRLSTECAKLNPTFEKAMAEEGLNEDICEWPEY
ncbi:MAG: ribbon-helix-helix domain-containing protein [Actinomycetota bacterium]|nr:ribbon-helix-helix domain-containing protein [Actinomycetota bacterium]